LLSYIITPIMKIGINIKKNEQPRLRRLRLPLRLRE
jgi:hypothetical protein